MEDVEKILARVLRLVAAFVAGVGVCAVLTLLTGCRTVRYVSVPEYHTEYKTRVAYRYVYRNVGDTILRTDSVRVPLPVERRPGWWERTKTECFVPVCCVCGIIILLIYRRKQ